MITQDYALSVGRSKYPGGFTLSPHIFTSSGGTGFNRYPDRYYIGDAEIINPTDLEVTVRILNTSSYDDLTLTIKPFSTLKITLASPYIYMDSRDTLFIFTGYLIKQFGAAAGGLH